MTPPMAVIAVALVLLVPETTDAQSREQLTIDAQLAAPKLDSRAIVAELDMKAVPLGAIIGAIAKSSGITVRYHSAVTNLDALSTAKLSNAAAGDALQTVLAPKALTFKATGARSVFIYPDTSENRAKYSESVRAFAIATADVAALTTTLNRAITPTADDLRPTIVSVRDSRTIHVRATPDMMAKVAEVIADNDKPLADRVDQATKPGSQAKKAETCIDEQELTFSTGSLRKVTNQVQKCEAGIWVIDPMNGPKDPALEKAKPCVGIKDQAYAAGVLREVKDKLERCQDGKWVAWTK